MKRRQRNREEMRENHLMRENGKRDEEKIRVDRGGCDARGSAAEFNNNFSNENYQLSSVASRKAMLTIHFLSPSPIHFPSLSFT